MENKLNITIVFGTRPEAIKLSPLILGFEREEEVNIKVILTGQHKEMVYQVLKLFEIVADKNLSLMSKCQTLTHITCSTLEGLQKEFSEDQPDLVIVQGDTTTSLAGALAAFYNRIPIAHVEAGLRTDDIYDPFPEEANRRLISQIASINLAPTQKSFETLKVSKIPGDVYLTGNTVIDALLIMSKRQKKIQIKGLNLANEEIILVTVHRRENWGKNIENICNGILKILEVHKDIVFVLPLHLNPIVKEPLKNILGEHPRIVLIEPLDYEDLVAVMKESKIILTDSGGLQEEAPSLGKPVLVLRKTTERPEAVEAGTAKLIGTSSEKIYKEVDILLRDHDAYLKMSQAINPFGDGHASDRIIKICKDWLRDKTVNK